MPPISPMIADVLILLTALILYGLAWISVGSLPRAIRGMARLALLVILIAPIVVSITIGTKAPQKSGDGPVATVPSRAPAPVPSTDGGKQAPASSDREAAGRRAADMKAAEDAVIAERQRQAAATKAAEQPKAAAEPPAPVYKTEVPPTAPVPERSPAGTADESRQKSMAEPPAPPPPAPARSAARPAAPVTATPDSTDWAIVPVFYGTDRKATAETKRVTYGSERAGKLDLGRVLVTVPKTHQVPNIERPWAIKVPLLQITIYQQTEDPKQHFTIKEIARLDKADFLSMVKERLAASSRYDKQAVVFVHGYNTEFDFAVFRTAQMAYDLDFDGVPFLYSWPSGTGITGYVSDRESAEQAEPYLRDFLDMVVRETGAKSVSVIAHSMGNLPLLRVLRDIGPTLPDGVKLDQIVLAAPDVDRSVFEQLARDISKVGTGVTLYASSTDRAMEAARRVAGGAPRAGDVPPGGPVIIPGIDTIDVTAISMDALALNHSSYAERSAMLNDIGLILRTRERPPEKRIPILEKITIDRGAYWRYPAQR